MSQASYFTCSFKPPCISDLIRQEKKGEGRNNFVFPPSGQGLRPLVVGGKKVLKKIGFFCCPLYGKWFSALVGRLMDGFRRWGGIISSIGIKIFVGKRSFSFFPFSRHRSGNSGEKFVFKTRSEWFSHPQIFGFRRNEGRRPFLFSRTVVISQKYIEMKFGKGTKQKTMMMGNSCGFKKRNGKSVAVEVFFISLFIVRQSPFRSARRFKTRFLKMFFWGNGRVMGL